MKIVNRGFLIVQPKQAFIDWATTQDPEVDLFGELEPSVYLIEEDFFEEEPIIEQNFKNIFFNELEAVSEDEDAYPEVNRENFDAWFSVSAGSAVYDAQKGGLHAE